MRTLLRLHLDQTIGNQAIADGSLSKTMQELLERLQPEAAYFCTDRGRRSAFIVFDMADAAQIPVVAEPLFSRLGADVEFTPVMNSDDLLTGLTELSQVR